MKSWVKFHSLIMIVFLIAGCSGKPSDTKIESMYKGYVTKTEAGGLLYAKLVDIKNFKKLNGFEKDARTYLVDVTFDRIFKIGSKDVQTTLTNEELVKIFGKSDIFTNVPQLVLISARDQNRPIPSVYSLYAHFNAGDKIHSCSKYGIEMIKSDNGWVISQVTCSRPSDSQIEAMYQAYSNSSTFGVKMVSIKNFVKVKVVDKDDSTYFVDVKFDRVYKLGLNELRDKLSKEQYDKLALQGNFNAGEKINSASLRFQMSKTSDGWVISQVGFPPA